MTKGIVYRISGEEKSILFEGPAVGTLESAVFERRQGLLDAHNGRLRAAGRPTFSGVDINDESCLDYALFKINPGSVLSFKPVQEPRYLLVAVLAEATALKIWRLRS